MSYSVKCCDAREILADLPDDCYVISDPPYNQGYHYDSYTDDLQASEYSSLMAAVFYGRKASVMHYPEELCNILVPAIGPVRDVMAWVYPTNQAKQHRLVGFWGCKPDWARTPQPYKNPTDKRVKALMAAGKSARGYDWIEVNHVKNVSKAGHPCPMPMALAERLVLALTVPGDTICDPFCGSGTVLVAAVKHGRNAIGCDVSATYVELALSNLKEVVE